MSERRVTELLAVASVGDVLDRLSILTIKQARVRAAEALGRVNFEVAGLRRAWADAGLPDPEGMERFSALLVVNTALWEVEDRLRAFEAAADFGSGFVADARSVYRLNDQRAALKRWVNEDFGSSVFEVKQHPTYGAHAAPAARVPTVASPPVGLTHVDAAGEARMVEVGDKPVTARSATAVGRVQLSAEALAAVIERRAKKGDVLGVAQIAGIMAAKRTSELIPLCHPLPLDGVDLHLTADAETRTVGIEATVRCTGRTGVEMEALTAVSVAALTVYDMLKAVDRHIVIAELRLLAKSGGRSGDWRAAPRG